MQPPRESPYLREDIESSRLARKLRDYSDEGLAAIPTLSPTHIAMLCRHHETVETILMQAVEYELARRRAFPKQS